jgi:hypothetical protein
MQPIREIINKVGGRTSFESFPRDFCTYIIFEHVVSFAIKETRSRHNYHFRMGGDTVETYETGPSRIWKRALGCQRKLKNYFWRAGHPVTIEGLWFVLQGTLSVLHISV